MSSSLKRLGLLTGTTGEDKELETDQTGLNVSFAQGNKVEGETKKCKITVLDAHS